MVNWGFIVGVQGTRWEDLVGYKACEQYMDDNVGGCFTLGESVCLLLLIFSLVPANCFNSFFAWMHFSACFVYNCLCALCHRTKNVHCYQWICLYL